MLESITKDISFRNQCKIMVPLFGAAYAAPNKGTTILYWFRPPKTVLNPLANCKIQGLFKAFECFSSTFQDKFYFQGLSRQSNIFKYFSSLCEPCTPLYTRGCWFDPLLLQSVRWDVKRWPCLHMTLAVGGTLNTHTKDIAGYILVDRPKL